MTTDFHSCTQYILISLISCIYCDMNDHEGYLDETPSRRLGGRKRGWVGVGSFITPQNGCFVVEPYISLCTKVTFFFFRVVRRMFLIWPCILCICSHIFTKEKKIRRVLVLIKKISMFQVLCFCDLIKKHGFTLKFRPAQRNRRHHLLTRICCQNSCLTC